MELPNHAKQLLLQLNQQRAKGILCDVIIVVENALFRAHKNILAASSMYFKSLVLHDNLINLDTDMVNPTSFQQILDFIYTGKLLTTNETNKQNFSALFTAASYLQLPDLAAICEKKMKHNRQSSAGRVGSTPSTGRLLHSQRLSTASIITYYSELNQEMKGCHSEEVLKGNISDNQVFISNSNQEISHAFHRGISNYLNGNSGGQDLGLNLSKKSPLLTPTASQDDKHNKGGFLQTALALTANSALFFEESTTGVSHSLTDTCEPMEMDLSEHQSLLERSQWKSLSYSSHKKERIKKNNTIDKENVNKETERNEWIPNGICMGLLFKSAEQSLGLCTYELDMENSKENSGDSGQSESESIGPTSSNYVYQQEGYEPVAFGDNLYVCIPCGKGFSSSEQLNAHVEKHTEEDLYVKEEGTYDDKEEVENLSNPNQLYMTESRPFKCSMCEKSYKDPATLQQHEKTHLLMQPFPCNICGKMFTQRGTMTRHVRSHLGLKPFACKECGMRFTRQYRLTEHMRVHSGEKPYKCQLCGRNFTQQRNLISHLRMHTSST